jgi:hypothetical protein
LNKQTDVHYNYKINIGKTNFVSLKIKTDARNLKNAMEAVENIDIWNTERLIGLGPGNVKSWSPCWPVNVDGPLYGVFAPSVEGIHKNKDTEQIQFISPVKKASPRRVKVAEQKIEAVPAVEEAVQEVAQELVAEEPVAIRVAPVVVPEFKKKESQIKFKSVDSRVEFNYERLMREIERVFTGPRSSPEMKKKYEIVKTLLENSNSPDEVRIILEENEVAFGSNSITSGGSRKRRQMRKKQSVKRFSR